MRAERRFGIDPIATVMAHIAAIVFAIGVLLALPFDSFAVSPTYAFVLRHYGETFWSCIMLVLGALGLLVSWLEGGIRRLEREGLQRLDPKISPSRRASWFIWQIVAATWLLFSFGLFLANAPTPGRIVYLGIAALSQWVTRELRTRR